MGGVYTLAVDGIAKSNRKEVSPPMKKPLARLLLATLLLLLVVTQVAALNLPKPLDPPIIIDPPIDLPPIDLPTGGPIDPIDPLDPFDPGFTPIDPPLIPLDPPTTPVPFNPPASVKPIDPLLPKDPVPPPAAPTTTKPFNPPASVVPLTPLKPPTIPTIPQLPGGTGPAPGTPGKPEVSVPDKGEFITSEGPLFLMYRGDLTKGYEMFTPLNLSVDGEYYFPLISNAMHKVGEIKVSVTRGIVIATPLVTSGVTLSRNFMTFFPDIAGVVTIDPAQIENGNVPFGVPVDVGIRFNTDPKVLLYVNCAVKYDASLPGITPFSLESPDYLERMYALILLMD